MASACVWSGTPLPPPYRSWAYETGSNTQPGNKHAGLCVLVCVLAGNVDGREERPIAERVGALRADSREATGVRRAPLRTASIAPWRTQTCNTSCHRHSAGSRRYAHEPGCLAAPAPLAARPPASRARPPAEPSRSSPGDPPLHGAPLRVAYAVRRPLSWFIHAHSWHTHELRNEHRPPPEHSPQLYIPRALVPKSALKRGRHLYLSGLAETRLPCAQRRANCLAVRLCAGMPRRACCVRVARCQGCTRWPPALSSACTPASTHSCRATGGRQSSGSTARMAPRSPRAHSGHEFGVVQAFGAAGQRTVGPPALWGQRKR